MKRPPSSYTFPDPLDRLAATRRAGVGYHDARAGVVPIPTAVTTGSTEIDRTNVDAFLNLSKP